MHLFGFKSSEIFPCHLHAFERIMEMMLYNVTRGKKEKKEAMLENFSHHPYLHSLSFVPMDELLDEAKDNRVERMSMVTGNQIQYLFNNIKILDPLFDDPEEEKKIFLMLKDLWNFLHQDLPFYSEENLKKMMSLWKKLLQSFKIYSTSDAYFSIYIHILSKHLAKCIARLNNMKLTFLDVDQSSFEMGNLILKNINSGAISKQPHLKKNLPTTFSFLRDSAMFNYQEVLKFRENMNESELKLYKKQFQALQIMFAMCRPLYAAAYRYCELNEIPDMNRQPMKRKDTTQSPNFHFFDSMEQISQEEFDELMSDEVQEDCDYEELEKKYAQSTKTTQDITNTFSSEEHGDNQPEQRSQNPPQVSIPIHVQNFLRAAVVRDETPQEVEGDYYIPEYQLQLSQTLENEHSMQQPPNQDDLSWCAAENGQDWSSTFQPNSSNIFGGFGEQDDDFQNSTESFLHDSNSQNIGSFLNDTFSNPLKRTYSHLYCSNPDSAEDRNLLFD